MKAAGASVLAGRQDFRSLLGGVDAFLDEDALGHRLALYDLLELELCAGKLSFRYLVNLVKGQTVGEDNDLLLAVRI